MRSREPPSNWQLVLWLALILFGVLPWLESKHATPVDEPARPPPAIPLKVTDPDALRADIDAARRIRRSEPDAALRHIQRALQQASDPDTRATLLEWAAEIHYKRWHLHRARDALQEAIDLAPNYKRTQHLADIQELIRRSQSERGKAAEYRAARDAGPAATLSGRVVIAYLFVDPPGISRWSDSERLHAREVLTRVQHWYQAQAQVHGATAPEFVERVFQVPLGGGDLPMYSDGRSTRRAAKLLAANLGHDSPGALLRSLARSENADQVMFMVHSPSDGRSFTMYCARRAFCDEEIAILLEPIKGHRWDRVAYAVAHEGLHLFGADDLYDVRGAIDYSPTDIMNYPSARLGHSEVGKLTAWAVGWRADQPDAPFTVEE